MILRTTHTPQTKEPIDLNIYVDADWAGCPSARKSTSGFVVTMMGSVVQFGTRTQAVESELYAIGTGAQEGLHIANFIKEATTTKVNIRTHTDSTSGKSIATRIGSKHIDLKYLFIQQLVQSRILSIHKISTHDNPADILTKYVPAEVLNKHLYTAGIQCPQHHN